MELTKREYNLKYLDYVGLDEAGRGCVGGSMFFVGVKLNSNKNIEEFSYLCDSKKTSKTNRLKMI